MISPIFIVGASRSGTSMLRLILNAHSQIGIPNELKYFQTLPSRLDWTNWRAPQCSSARYQRFVHTFLHKRKNILEEVGIDQLEQHILSSKQDLREPYRLATEAWAQHHGKERWGEKTPHNLFYVDIINDMFPAAQFIHLVRDPRAVTHSMNNVEYCSNDTALNALNWRRALTEGVELLESSVPAPRRFTVRYEDLVREPEEHIKRLCTFIDAPYEPDMLTFHRDAEEYLQKSTCSPSVAEPAHNTPALTQPVRKLNATKWRHGLSTSEVALVESICRKEMKRFGYQRSNITPGLRSYLSKTIKQAYWRIQRRRNAGRRDFLVYDPMFTRSRRRLKRLLGSP